jgi:hypothetical protein
VPLFVVVKDGVEIARHAGYATVEELKKLVGTNRSSVPDSPKVPPRVVDSPAPERDPPLPNKPVFGENGWRLRLLYPVGSGRADDLRKLFLANDDLARFGKTYGYEAIPTSSYRFKCWEEKGYKADEISLVLVNADDSIVYLQHKFPMNGALLYERLTNAANEAVDWSWGWRRVR